MLSSAASMSGHAAEDSIASASQSPAVSEAVLSSIAASHAMSSSRAGEGANRCEYRFELMLFRLTNVISGIHFARGGGEALTTVGIIFGFRLFCAHALLLH